MQVAIQVTFVGGREPPPTLVLLLMALDLGLNPMWLWKALCSVALMLVQRFGGEISNMCVMEA